MIYHVGRARSASTSSVYFSVLTKLAAFSGGSITAGMLALAWHRLQFSADGVATNFNGRSSKSHCSHSPDII